MHRSVADRWNSVRSEVFGRWTFEKTRPYHRTVGSSIFLTRYDDLIAKPERTCLFGFCSCMAGALSHIKKRGGILAPSWFTMKCNHFTVLRLHICIWKLISTWSRWPSGTQLQIICKILHKKMWANYTQKKNPLGVTWDAISQHICIWIVQVLFS